MRAQFLTAQEDIDWLFETHLKHLGKNDESYKRCQSFVIFGNEDSPDKVELYDTRNPLVMDKPFFTEVLTIRVPIYNLDNDDDFFKKGEK